MWFNLQSQKSRASFVFECDSLIFKKVELSSSIVSVGHISLLLPFAEHGNYLRAKQDLGDAFERPQDETLNNS